MRIVITGPPGAGKSTQAQLLATRLNVPHVSTGDLFRHNQRTGTPLGRRAERFLAAGELVPDELTVAMMRDRLAHGDATAGFVLDGFPRTGRQAEALEDILAQANVELDAVIELAIPDDVLLKRLLGRGRRDDNIDTIRERLRTYREKTAPLRDFYRDLLITINADGTVEEVHHRVLHELKAEG